MDRVLEHDLPPAAASRRPTARRIRISEEASSTSPRDTPLLDSFGSRVGGGAAGGPVLGRLLGGKSKTAAVGSAVGAAVGTAIASGIKGQEVGFPAGAALTVTLDQPVVIDVVP